MRRLSIAVVAMSVSLFMASLVHGDGVVETFNQFDPYALPYAYTNTWYFTINELNPTGVYIGDVDPGAGVDSAAYFYLNQSVLNPAVSNVVRFQTSNLNQTLLADEFSAEVDVVFQGAPSSALASVNYYMGIDFDGDLNEDTMYFSPALASNPVGIWEYTENRSILGGDNWHQYDWNGTGWTDMGLVGSIAPAITDYMLFLGVQFNVNAFTASSTDYMTMWADNVMVPEPSALILACLGVVGLLGRRTRRQAA